MAKKKHSALGKRLIASAKEMAAHAKGRLHLEGYRSRIQPTFRSELGTSETGEHRARILAGNCAGPKVVDRARQAPPIIG